MVMKRLVDWLRSDDEADRVARNRQAHHMPVTTASAGPMLPVRNVNHQVNESNFVKRMSKNAPALVLDHSINSLSQLDAWLSVATATDPTHVAGALVDGVAEYLAAVVITHLGASWNDNDLIEMPSGKLLDPHRISISRLIEDEGSLAATYHSLAHS